ncbi:MAG: hypothetical protein Cons2KO_34370 [Congregibacter sp.]
MNDADTAKKKDTDVDREFFSTSALAKRIKLPIQQLFVTLRDYGWIERADEGWLLTAKGELHGGRYQNSKRYGRYIVWPESIVEHPLLTAIESNQRISFGGMCRYFGHLTAPQIARAMGELGLISSSGLGHKLTPFGETFGGRQERDEDSALPTISWPHEIVDHPVIHRELNRLLSGRDVSQQTSNTEKEDSEQSAAEEGEPAIHDLFSDVPSVSEADQATDHCTIDGHSVESALQRKVCDWLYTAQLAHARNRALPVEEPLTADFYVPAAGLYIECWERDVPTADLTRRLRVREVCRELKFAYQEVAASDIDRIDELLTVRFASLGIAR